MTMASLGSPFLKKDKIMIQINHNSRQSDNNPDNSPHNNVREVEIERRRRRDEDECCECDDDDEDEGRRRRLRTPVVQAPVVAVTGGTTTIGAFRGRVVVQVLNNVALLAEYTIVLQPLGRCDQGFVIVETANGITNLNVLGASNVSSSALTTAGSYIILRWSGCVWVQV